MLSVNDLNLEDDAFVVRAMPNLALVIGQGMTGIYAPPTLPQDLQYKLSCLFSAVGQVIWAEDEDQLNIVTAISGSGPAYFFYFMELMQNTAIQMGLSPETAIQLAKQTAYGAAKLAMESPESVEMLRKRITSKGGTTEAALSVFQNGLPDLIQKAMEAARDRAIVIKEMVS